MEGSRIRQIFILLLGLTYMAMGVFIFIRKVVPYSPWGELLSLLFVVYGAWRCYRAVTMK